MCRRGLFSSSNAAEGIFAKSAVGDQPDGQRGVSLEIDRNVVAAPRVCTTWIATAGDLKTRDYIGLLHTVYLYIEGCFFGLLIKFGFG